MWPGRFGNRDSAARSSTNCARNAKRMPNLAAIYDSYVKRCEGMGVRAASYEVYMKTTRSIPEFTYFRQIKRSGMDSPHLATSLSAASRGLGPAEESRGSRPARP